jgi:hypothetical protein
MKTNLVFRWKNDERAKQSAAAAKANLTILLLFFVALALAGCEGIASGSSGGVSPWPAAPTGSSAPPTSQAGFGSGLGGRWYHDGKPTSIDVASDGRRVTVTDENGFRTYGDIMSSREFVITSSFERLRGTMSPDGKRISWSNGGTWTREPNQSVSHPGPAPGQQGVSGRWYHDGKPTSVSMSPGGSITITDENGITTSGHMMGNNEFMMSSMLRGTFSPDGRRISWSNGGTWTR